ncbi:MAG TPA: aldolase/citrate lyase family protein, partial [Anseongella sp.]|nr:aldolase/citrate lyase family protein [Anseongella sp.]
MKAEKDMLLNRLRNGENVYGTCITSTAPLWPAAVSSAGLDFVFLDTEHVPLGRTELAGLCQVYRMAGITPIVRIPSPDPFLACQAIDAGAKGVIAPYLESVEQVTQLTGAVK